LSASTESAASLPPTAKVFLYYWQRYWTDADGGNLPLRKLNQNSRVMQLIHPGDVVWAFARRRTDGVYVLVARFLVSRVGENDDDHPDREVGLWFFEGEPEDVIYLDPQEQDDVEPVIRSLEIKADASVLGLSFQGGSGVRQITEAALRALDQHAGIALLAASEGDPELFDPENIIAAREQITRSIKARRGQQAFRDALLKAYEGRCAITGCSVVDVLEAAHVTPYLGPETNHITNGLLLRADLHTLLDCGLIGIDPSTRTVILASTLRTAPDYRDLHGRRLSDPVPPSAAPSPKALAILMRSMSLA
jgi:hypothetical protein